VADFTGHWRNPESDKDHQTSMAAWPQIPNLTIEGPQLSQPSVVGDHRFVLVVDFRLLGLSLLLPLELLFLLSRCELQYPLSSSSFLFIKIFFSAASSTLRFPYLRMPGKAEDRV